MLHTSLCLPQGLTNKECMLCVLTAFEILSGQGAGEHSLTHSHLSTCIFTVKRQSHYVSQARPSTLIPGSSIFSCMELYFSLILVGPKREVKVQFTSHSCVSVSSSDDVLLALSCMDKMMRKRRQVYTDIVYQ